MASVWTREALIKIYEALIEANSTILGHPEFRKHLTRDQKLYANQVTREATGNLAYRSVEFDVERASDEEFWHKVDESKYRGFIEDNAAIAILKMAEKLNLLN